MHPECRRVGASAGAQEEQNNARSNNLSGYVPDAQRPRLLRERMEAGCVDIDATDVAMMMALLKIARIAGGAGTRDSFIDLAGYAACGGECADV